MMLSANGRQIWNLSKSILLTTLLAGGFAYWFANSQLHAVSLLPTSVAAYPLNEFILTILRCGGVIVLFSLISSIFLSGISGGKIKSFSTGLTYFPLMLVYAKFSLLTIACLIIFLQGSLLFVTLRVHKSLSYLNKYAFDFVALCVLFLLHLFLTTGLSPLYWQTAWHTSFGTESISMVAPVFKNYVLAKQFVFSSMDYSVWAGILNPPITLNSPFLSFLTLVFDLPSISIEHFHILLLTVYFVLVVMGSFGFYLFLKYAAKINFALSLFGGCLFFFSGAPFISTIIVADGGVFLSSYLIFPYALLFLSLAFEKNNYLLSACASLALASQFIFMTPHPEGTIYSFLFYGVYGVGLLLFSPLPMRNKVILLGVAWVTLVLLSGFAIGPIVIDQYQGSMRTFAHIGDIATTPFHFYDSYLGLMIIAAVSIVPLFIRKKASPLYLSAIFLFVTLFIFLLLTSSEAFNNWLINFLHLGLHVWSYWRIGVFFALSLFIITLFFIDRLTKDIFINLRSIRLPFGYIWKTTFFAIAALLSFQLVTKFIPWQRITNNESHYNPQACSYYFSLQSLLVNYPLLERDKANIGFIKQRISQFENSVNKTDVYSGITANYKTKYASVLKTFNVTSINMVGSEAVILPLAKVAAPIIDSYYLDKNLFCHNPFYDWDATSSFDRRIIRYNLSGLYESLPSKFSTILSAIGNEWLSGPAPGLLIHNQTTTMDTRFMVTLPLLTALYALPKNDFQKMGNYEAPAPWSYMQGDTLNDPIIRKVLDVGGIDIFTVKKSDIKDKVINHTNKLIAHVDPVFDAGFESLVNQQSYSIAYLANHITYIDPASVKEDEDNIRRYLNKRDDLSQFLSITNRLYKHLLDLKHTHDIILESISLPQLDSSQFSGEIQIHGIVGERAAFTAHCPNKECIFVFNIAKSPGWHAFINHHETEVKRANFSFMAVVLPQGISNIWFVYEPVSRWLTDLISLITAICILFMCQRYLASLHNE